MKPGRRALLAGAVVVPVGAVLAVPAIRSSGLYLAIATFGFGQSLTVSPLSLCSPTRLSDATFFTATAGGSNVVRYGNTRELCLGLEVVLPDGRVMDLLNRSRVQQGFEQQVVADAPQQIERLMERHRQVGPLSQYHDLLAIDAFDVRDRIATLKPKLLLLRGFRISAVLMDGRNVDIYNEAGPHALGMAFRASDQVKRGSYNELRWKHGGITVAMDLKKVVSSGSGRDGFVGMALPESIVGRPPEQLAVAGVAAGFAAAGGSASFRSFTISAAVKMPSILYVSVS